MSILLYFLVLNAGVALGMLLSSVVRGVAPRTGSVEDRSSVAQ